MKNIVSFISENWDKLGTFFLSFVVFVCSVKNQRVNLMTTCDTNIANAKLKVDEMIYDYNKYLNEVKYQKELLSKKHFFIYKGKNAIIRIHKPQKDECLEYGQLIEDYLNAVEYACMLYKHHRINRKLFISAHLTDIKTINEDENFSKYLNDIDYANILSFYKKVCLRK